MLGLPEGFVFLVGHDPGWLADYETEAGRIAAALGQRMLAIQHCGSTAVPGLKAKPILDIVLGVGDLRQAGECIPKLADLGYRHVAEVGIPGQLFFRKGDPTTHHLHLAPFGGESWHKKIAFRDALRGSPALACSYERLKLEFAGRFATDRASYTQAKAGFVRDVLAMVRDPRPLPALDPASVRS